jgi:5-formaminoimidazole-4-carboxamide-1-(beta)-D-ribofuranosyl 5'-monophosphate synthetase
VLDWEASRELQRIWLTRAGLKVPRQFKTGAEIDRPVIVKLYGAQGGKGYMFVRDAADFERRAGELARQNYILQEYIIGVPFYIHYFYSPLTGKLEIMSMDRRYETNVDSLGRIPAAAQEGMDVEPELRRGRQLAAVAARVDAGRSLPDGRRRGARQPGDLPPKGLFGAFCIETIITPDAQFYIMEVSARIVAGTNLFIDGSPYSYLNYSEPMSTGRRIAREIKNALLSNSLQAALVQVIVADVRAYNLTKDARYRSALVQHAADPGLPLQRVPDPESGEMFGLVKQVARIRRRGESGRCGRGAQRRRAPQARSRIAHDRPRARRAARRAVDPHGARRRILRAHQTVAARRA